MKNIIKKGINTSIGFAVGALSLFTYQQLDHKLYPTTFPILERKGYTIAYDTQKKIPFWTHEHLTKQSLVKAVEKIGQPFQADADVYHLHQSDLIDYVKSGFHRGHIVPARDEQFSKEALKETFYLSNVAPQYPKFNLGSWKRLETFLRELVQAHNTLEIISGPLFLSHEENGKRFVTYEVIGKNEVAVPTHFFKVVTSKDKTWAYVMPNMPILQEKPLESFILPIDSLEKISGIQFQHLNK